MSDNSHLIVFCRTSARAITTFNPVTRTDYYSHKTLEQMQAEHGPNPLVLIDSETCRREIDAHHTTPVKFIDDERYHDLLEAMPPCKWQRTQGVTMFHLGERITNNIVTWVCCAGSQHYEFNADADMTAQAVVDAIRAFVAAQAAAQSGKSGVQA
jgi:hypothetical protein